MRTRSQATNARSRQIVLRHVFIQLKVDSFEWPIVMKFFPLVALLLALFVLGDFRPRG